MLTRLKEDQEENNEAEPAEADFRIRGLGAGFITPDGRPSGADADVGAYFDYLNDWPGEKQSGNAEAAATDLPPETTIAATVEEKPLEQEPVMPAHLQRLTEAEIAEDLAITARDTEASLNEKRRQFARDNHPDGVVPQFRDNATTRMKIANLMIDRAIKELFWRR